jgi:hypothetical protein
MLYFFFFEQVLLKILYKDFPIIDDWIAWFWHLIVEMNWNHHVRPCVYVNIILPVLGDLRAYRYCLLLVEADSYSDWIGLDIVYRRCTKARKTGRRKKRQNEQEQTVAYSLLIEARNKTREKNIPICRRIFEKFFKVDFIHDNDRTKSTKEIQSMRCIQKIRLLWKECSTSLLRLLVLCLLLSQRRNEENKSNHVLIGIASYLYQWYSQGWVFLFFVLCFCLPLYNRSEPSGKETMLVTFVDVYQ